jgi:hypothetical protein
MENRKLRAMLIAIIEVHWEPRESRTPELPVLTIKYRPWSDKFQIKIKRGDQCVRDFTIDPDDAVIKPIESVKDYENIENGIMFTKLVNKLDLAPYVCYFILSCEYKMDVLFKYNGECGVINIDDDKPFMSMPLDAKKSFHNMLKMLKGHVFITVTNLIVTDDYLHL